MIPCSKRHLFGALALTLSALLCDCSSGDDSDLGETAGVGGTGGASGGGGTSGSGGMGGSAGAGISGTSGIAGAAGFDGADPSASCQPPAFGEVVLTGSQVHGVYGNNSGGTEQGDAGWNAYWSLTIGGQSAGALGRGLLSLEGAEITDSGWGTISSGLLQIPAAHNAGDWYCIGGGKAHLTQQTPAFELNHLSRLGTCPGTPIDGEIGFCDTAPAAGETPKTPASCVDGHPHMSGSYGGIQVDDQVELRASGGGSFYGDVYGEAAFRFGGGLIAIAAGQDVETYGVVMLPNGDLLCAGAGSEVFYDGSSTQILLKSLSVLGSCPGTPVDGEISGCSH